MARGRAALGAIHEQARTQRAGAVATGARARCGPAGAEEREPGLGNGTQPSSISSVLFCFVLEGEVELFRGCFKFCFCCWQFSILEVVSVQSAEAISVLREGWGMGGRAALTYSVKHYRILRADFSQKPLIFFFFSLFFFGEKRGVSFPFALILSF